MIKEAIILAGGLGTRLRSVISGLPKCMAPVAGKPFLHYLIEYLQKKEIEKFIFSVGYKHEIIEEYLQKDFGRLDYKISLEAEPLGTGGAIKLGCERSSQKNVLICNGDTLFKIDIASFFSFHRDVKATCSLCLKPMRDFNRYGVVELNKDHSVESFKEKQFYTSGLINGGIYLLDTIKFLQENYPEKFSFEKDYLERKVDLAIEQKPALFAMVQDQYFIDIGIPEDYERAGRELK